VIEIILLILEAIDVEMFQDKFLPNFLHTLTDYILKITSLTSAKNSVGAEMLSSASVYSLRSSLLLDVGFSKPTFPLSSVVMVVKVLEQNETYLEEQTSFRYVFGGICSRESSQ
jgi:hypothetical protein